MNNFGANYRKILETLQQIESRMNFLNQIRKPKLSDIELIAVDLTSEYMSVDYQMDLFESNLIRLEVPMRKNQLGYNPQAYILRKSRKRIETLFSQLCDQFMIRRNYAKSFMVSKTEFYLRLWR